jgi:hypothetical protein
MEGQIGGSAVKSTAYVVYGFCSTVVKEKRTNSGTKYFTSPGFQHTIRKILTAPL